MGGPAQFLFGGLSSSFQETTRIRARFAYIASARPPPPRPLPSLVSPQGMWNSAASLWEVTHTS